MNSKIFQKRRDNGAVCPVCKHPDYVMLAAYYIGGKPNIQCNKCKNMWQYGRDGGIYNKLRTN